MKNKSMDRLREDIVNRFGRGLLVLLKFPILLVNMTAKWFLVMKSWSIMCRA